MYHQLKRLVIEYAEYGNDTILQFKNIRRNGTWLEISVIRSCHAADLTSSAFEVVDLTGIGNVVLKSAFCRIFDYSVRV